MFESMQPRYYTCRYDKTRD